MALTISNAYLDIAQMAGNGQYIADYLIGKGWTQSAVAAILGNMQQESNINPGVWQDLNYGNMDGGYGLVQWTPATNYTSWADSRGYPWGGNYTNKESYINGQLERILWEVTNGTQWIPTAAFDFSFTAFTKSAQSPEYLTEAFLKNYERAGTEALSERKQFARYWYNNLSYSGSGESDTIRRAVEWAVDIANDDTHGYDQINRDGPDYDCSSLLIHAWENAGVPVMEHGANYTGDMYDAFIQCGFKDVTSQVNCETGNGIEYGDVLLNVIYHTAMSIGNGNIVQASMNEFNDTKGGQTGDQTGKEIYTRSYYNYVPGGWDYVLRYPGGGTTPPPKKVSLIQWIPE